MGYAKTAQGTEGVRNGPYPAQERIHQGNPGLARSLFGTGEIEGVKHNLQCNELKICVRFWVTDEVDYFRVADEAGAIGKRCGV